MSLPHDHDVQFQLLALLENTPNGRLHCQDIYRRLASRFPQLTADDVEIPYKNSCSHWANRVQWGRHHLVLQGYLLPAYLSGREVWAISEGGRLYVRSLKAKVDQLLREIDNLPD